MRLLARHLNLALSGLLLISLPTCLSAQSAQSEEELEEQVFRQVERLRGSNVVSETVGHDAFEITLRFYGDIELEDGRALPWTEERRRPYRRAARRWLMAIRGVEGRDHHRLALHIVAMPFPFGNGGAQPEDDTFFMTGDVVIPENGEIIINSFLLEPEAQEEAWIRNEEYHNALHEMGHVFGIGALWNIPAGDPESWEEFEDMDEDDITWRREWVIDDDARGGLSYTQPHAVAAFQRVMETDLEFVPIGSDGGHLFALYDEEGPRRTAGGVEVPAADLELMSHRNVLSEISLGFLHDLGYVVDYDAADPYVAGAVTDIELPDPSAPAWANVAFSRALDTFGVRVYATESVPDERLRHAANVLAEYLDNDEDGLADNPRVVNALRAADAAMVMAADEDEFDEVIDRLERDFASTGRFPAIQDLYASETIPGGRAAGRFDATLEEVLHLVTHYGYSAVYPEQFAERPGSAIADAMDEARGGHFRAVPDRYPKTAWYSYDDETCDYGCQVTEYFYWGLTTLLGAQADRTRGDEIEEEWRPNTAAELRERDVALTRLLTDPWIALPTRLPDGSYDPAQPSDEDED